MTGPTGPSPAVIPDWVAATPPVATGAYHELLRVPALAVGRFTAPPGHEDSQEPHTEDEVYFVTTGEAHLVIGDDELAVGPGTIAYVPAGTPHRFTRIRQHLEVLVLFAPVRG